MSTDNLVVTSVIEKIDDGIIADIPPFSDTPNAKATVRLTKIMTQLDFVPGDIKTASTVILPIISKWGKGIEFDIKPLSYQSPVNPSALKSHTNINAFRISVSLDCPVNVSELRPIIESVQGKLIEAYIYVDQHRIKGASLQSDSVTARLAIDFIMLSERATTFARNPIFTLPKNPVTISDDMCDAIDKTAAEYQEFKTKEDKDIIKKVCFYFYNSLPDVPDLSVDLIFRRHSFQNQYQANKSSTTSSPPAQVEMICDIQVEMLDRISWSFLEYLQATLPPRVYDIQFLPTIENGLNARTMLLGRLSTVIHKQACLAVAPRSVTYQKEMYTGDDLTTSTMAVSVYNQKHQKRRRLDEDDYLQENLSDGIYNKKSKLS